MSHNLNQAPINHSRAFAFGVILNTAFVLTEVGFGVAAHSLALIADAGHNLSDVLGLLLAWGASYLARMRPTQRHTYGLRRSTILAALLNAAILLIAVGAIASDAFRRFAHPEPVAGGTVVGVAAFGVVINGVTALLFLSGRKQDLNIRGAFLHMTADAAISLGVVLAGLAIRATGWLWLDPAVGLAIAAVITAGTWGLLRESVNLALDAVPQGIDPATIETYLAGLPGVAAVHDLHIWAMSTTETALTAHLVMPNSGVDDGLLATLTAQLRDRFGVQHATVQLECGDESHPCGLAPSDVV